MIERVFFAAWLGGWAAWIIALWILSRSMSARASRDVWAQEICHRCGYERLRIPRDAVCPECGAAPPEDDGWGATGIGGGWKALKRDPREHSQPAMVCAVLIFAGLCGLWSLAVRPSMVLAFATAVFSAPAFAAAGMAIRSLAYRWSPLWTARLAILGMTPALGVIVWTTTDHGHVPMLHDAGDAIAMLMWLVGAPFCGYGLLLGSVAGGKAGAGVGGSGGIRSTPPADQ